MHHYICRTQSKKWSTEKESATVLWVLSRSLFLYTVMLWNLVRIRIFLPIPPTGAQHALQEKCQLAKMIDQGHRSDPHIFLSLSNWMKSGSSLQASWWETNTSKDPAALKSCSLNLGPKMEGRLTFQTVKYHSISMGLLMCYFTIYLTRSTSLYQTPWANPSNSMITFLKHRIIHYQKEELMRTLDTSYK